MLFRAFAFYFSFKGYVNRSSAFKVPAQPVYDCVTIRVNTYQFYDKRIQSTQIVIKYFMSPQMPAPGVFFMTKVELLLLYSSS